MSDYWFDPEEIRWKALRVLVEMVIFTLFGQRTLAISGAVSASIIEEMGSRQPLPMVEAVTVVSGG